MKKKIIEMPEYIPAPNGSVNLAMNENHHTKWNEFLADQIEVLSEKYAFNHYGDNAYKALTEVYAAYAGVEPNEVAPFSGSESAIGILMHALAEKNVMLFKPDFFRFKELAELHNRVVYEFEATPSIDEDAVIAFMKEHAIDFTIFATPNNPVGFNIPMTLIQRMLDETNAYIVVDEAYFEFSDSESAASLVKQYEKLLVLRTTSKAWALAGMRIGFVLAQAPMIQYLKKAIGPFHINTLSTEIAAEAIRNQEYMQENVDAIIKSREEWFDKLINTYGFEVVPSQTNFLYATHDDAIEIWEYLRSKNVFVSKFGDNNLRISIGTPEEMAVLEAELNTYFEK